MAAPTSPNKPVTLPSPGTGSAGPLGPIIVRLKALPPQQVRKHRSCQIRNLVKAPYLWPSYLRFLSFIGYNRPYVGSSAELVFIITGKEVGLIILTGVSWCPSPALVSYNVGSHLQSPSKDHGEVALCMPTTCCMAGCILYAATQTGKGQGCALTAVTQSYVSQGGRRTLRQERMASHSQERSSENGVPLSIWGGPHIGTGL